MSEERQRVRRWRDRRAVLRHEGMARVAMGAVASWAVLATIATVALIVQASRDNTATDQSAKAVGIAARTYRSQVALAEGQIDNGCHRLNVQRAVNNGNALVTYRALHVQITILQGFLPQTPGLRALERGDVVQAGRQRWIPLTNCRVAHTQGIAYKTPTPVRFRHRLPPSSALAPGPDN